MGLADPLADGHYDPPPADHRAEAAPQQASGAFGFVLFFNAFPPAEALEEQRARPELRGSP
jgi:hypothetical protein